MAADERCAVRANHAREGNIHIDDTPRHVDDDDAVRGVLKQSLKVEMGHECVRGANLPVR